MMYMSRLQVTPSGNTIRDEDSRRPGNSVSVFITPNDQNIGFQNPSILHTTKPIEPNFDEIEVLRAEVKRLTDMVGKQIYQIGQLSQYVKKNPTDTDTLDKLDLLTELGQNKISIACLERENDVMDSKIRNLKEEVSNLTSTINQQGNELLFLRTTMHNIVMGLQSPRQSPNSSSTDVRSASCAELPCHRYGSEELIRGGGRPVNSSSGVPWTARRGLMSQFPPPLPPSSRLNGSSSRKNDFICKSRSNGRLNNLVFFLKSPNLSIRRSGSRSTKFKNNNDPIIEDDFSSSETKSDSGLPTEKPLPVMLPTSIDFKEWPVDVVCDFLGSLGLGYCVASARKWVHTGADIITASNSQLKQNLGIQRPLHLKKLLIHVGLRTSEVLTASRDTAFLPKISPHPDFSVLAWLEDIGLPLYRELFKAELIDAYVLHELTLMELQTLGVNNELHMLSLRRGLQVLRQIDFNLSCLCRRAKVERQTSWRLVERKDANTGDDDDCDQDSCVSSPEPSQLMTTSTHSTPGFRTTPKSPLLPRVSPMHRVVCASSGAVFENAPSKCDPTVSSASRIALWTCHCLEHWLNSIELPEYVSNLRCSGLHGGLFVYEDRFTSETLAAVLDIRPERTLLRRHLSEHFSSLLGTEICARKLHFADHVSSSTSLAPTAKLKLCNRKQATRKLFDSSGNSRYLGSELLCPLEADFDFKATSTGDYQP